MSSQSFMSREDWLPFQHGVECRSQLAGASEEGINRWKKPMGRSVYCHELKGEIQASQLWMWAMSRWSQIWNQCWSWLAACEDTGKQTVPCVICFPSLHGIHTWPDSAVLGRAQGLTLWWFLTFVIFLKNKHFYLQQWPAPVVGLSRLSPKWLVLHRASRHCWARLSW